MKTTALVRLAFTSFQSPLVHRSLQPFTVIAAPAFSPHRPTRSFTSSTILKMSSSPSSEEVAVKEYLTEFSKKWLASSVNKDPAEFESVMGSMGFDTDCLFIRPSGNPADMNTFKAMVADGGMFHMKEDMLFEIIVM